MKKFYYSIGEIKTHEPWLCPPPIENVNAWISDFKNLNLEEYQVYIGGKYCIDWKNTSDVDICLTGPIFNYKRLYKIFKMGMELGFKHNILIDIKHYDNLDFFKYPRVDGFKRLHIVTEIAGDEVKKIDGKIVHQKTFKTNIAETEWIPKNISVNVTHFPLDKQIMDGRIYDPIKII